MDVPRAARMHAGLTYALPVVGALAILLRPAESRFARLHAARALWLYLLVLAVQTVFLIWLLSVGSSVSASSPAVALGLLAYALILALGGTSVWLVLRSLGDCAYGEYHVGQRVGVLFAATDTAGATVGRGVARAIASVRVWQRKNMPAR